MKQKLRNYCEYAFFIMLTVLWIYVKYFTWEVTDAKGVKHLMGEDWILVLLYIEFGIVVLLGLDSVYKVIIFMITPRRSAYYHLRNDRFARLLHDRAYTNALTQMSNYLQQEPHERMDFSQWLDENIDRSWDELMVNEKLDVKIPEENELQTDNGG